MNTAKEGRLGGLMQGLIYPAFLGAGFVWTAQSMYSQLNQNDSVFSIFLSVENYFALWLLVYFCVPYLILTRAKLKEPYGVIPFILDIGDGIAIFLAFVGLGLVTESTSDMQLVYCAIAAIPVLSFFSNLSLGRKPKLIVSLSALAITVPMAWCGHSVEICNLLAIFLLFVVLFFYIKDAAT